MTQRILFRYNIIHVIMAFCHGACMFDNRGRGNSAVVVGGNSRWKSIQEVYQNGSYLSAQKASPRKGPWFPQENGYCKRPQGSCPPPRPRPREADRFQSRLIELTISARQSAAPVLGLSQSVRSGPAKTGSGPFSFICRFWRQPRRALLICKELTA